MRFLMLVCLDSEPVTASSSEGMSIDQWVDTYDSNGVRLIGDQIDPASNAKTVRVRDDEVLVTDGPFIETKEVVAGFDVLECRDVQHAIEVAAAHPMARRGVLELRPFWSGD